ncbi:MAG: sulfurtransferase TusA family protein [Rhodospirillales bacterium]|nr:MAG: sulfurtransferase TusA family protein [Rhodospirillales bacterium]
MDTLDNSTRNHSVDYFLDISAEVCPLTFVRTKLLLERMQPGETAVIRLQGREPLDNVPKAVITQGHDVLSMEKENPAADAVSLHQLRIRKT